MPQLGLTMTEGTLIEWCVAIGEPINEGNVLYIVETDKIANEIPADRDGAIGEFVVAPGETVPVGAVLGRWSGARASEEAENDRVSTRGGENAVPDVAVDREVPLPAPPPAQTKRGSGDRIVATPHARKLARCHEVDLRQITGSGPRGRIKGCDVIAYANSPAFGATPMRHETGSRPLSGLRKTVAERMAQSNREIPHFYLSIDVEVSRLLTLHEELKAEEAFAKLTLTHWLVSAAGLCLAEHAEMARVFGGDHLVELNDTDIAVAVATERGLYAPVARAVGSQTLVDTVAQLDELVAKAHAGHLGAVEMSGGCLCISNLGGVGVTEVFPLIIPGQSMIIGVGRINEVFRPDKNGRPELRREISLVAGFDHRVHDGVEGGRFLNHLRVLLEKPLTVLVRERGDRPRF